MSSSSSERHDHNILDFTDEVLIEIILRLDGKSRISLANSCTRFNNLVFNENRLYRSLDFSARSYETTLSDLGKYFNKKKKYLNIRKLDIENMLCSQISKLSNLVHRAENIVELNIIGIEFHDVAQLSKFLHPMKHLRKLSLNWPDSMASWGPLVVANIKGSLSQLEYLMLCFPPEFQPPLRFVLSCCQNLRELRLLKTSAEVSVPITNQDMDIDGVSCLKSLEVFICSLSLPVPSVKIWELYIARLLPDIHQWTAFRWGGTARLDGLNYYYLEKNPKICDELSGHVFIEPRRKMITSHGGEKLEGPMSYNGRLLIDALRTISGIEHTNCLSKMESRCPGEYMLSIPDVKLLMINPKHQISFLNIRRSISSECRDGCLNGSPFPNVTKLVLSNVTQKREPNVKQEVISTGFKRKRTARNEESKSLNTSSPLQNLITDVPRVSDLTICGVCTERNEIWDLNALDQIPNWKNLTALCLAEIPIKDGRFLIAIGKKCTALSSLKLVSLGPDAICCYKRDLIEMLKYCDNLRDFSMKQKNIGQISDIFNALTTRSRLRRVRVKTLGAGNRTSDLLLTARNLCLCSDLILFIFEIETISQTACKELSTVLNRVKQEPGRSNFQFEIVKIMLFDRTPVRSILRFVHRDFIWPYCTTVNMSQLQLL